MLALIWKTAAALLGFAVFLVGTVALMQGWILFPRWAVTGTGPPLRADAEILRLDLPDGDRLAGLRLPARLPGGSERAALLGFGGTTWHAHAVAAHLCRLFPTRDVFAFHYRGYGPSTGRPGARAFDADALAIFDSLRAVARAHFPYLPVRWLLRHEIDVAGDMLRYGGPVAIIAAGHDRLIPPERTHALRMAVRHAVFDTVIEGAGHNEIYLRRAYARAMRAALLAIEADPDELEMLRASAPVDALPDCAIEL